MNNETKATLIIVIISGILIYFLLGVKDTFINECYEREGNIIAGQYFTKCVEKDGSITE